MNTKDDFIEQDEQECVDFILNHLPQDCRQRITDVEVYYVLDLIDFYLYETNLVDEETDTLQEGTIAEEDMLNFIMASIRKENTVELSEEDVIAILDGEYEYGKNKGIYIE